MGKGDDPRALPSMLGRGPRGPGRRGHAVDEPGGGVGHAARAAGGADAAALARKRDQGVPSTGFAKDAGETELQDSTAQERPKLAHDEAGETAVARIFVDAGEEALELAGQDAVEHGLLGPASLAGTER